MLGLKNNSDSKIAKKWTLLKVLTISASLEVNQCLLTYLVSVRDLKIWSFSGHKNGRKFCVVEMIRLTQSLSLGLYSRSVVPLWPTQH